MSFDKYAVIEPYKHVFEKEPDLYWLIKPPTIKEEIALSRFYQEGRVKIWDSQRVVYPWSNIEIAIRQLALLFAGTNIPKEGSEDPVLTDKSDLASIEKYLGSLPTPAVNELWKALGSSVPGWGPGNTDDQKN